VKILLKNTLFFAFVSLTLLSCTGEKKGNGTDAANDNNHVAASQGGVAFVNLDTLFTYYNYYNDLKKEFSLEEKKANNQFLSRKQKLEEEFQKYVAQAQSGRLSQNDIQKKERDLQIEQQKLAEFEQSLSVGLMQYQKDANDKLNGRINEYLEKYRSEHGLVAVFTYPTSSGIYAIEKQNDITQLILDQLNKSYEDELSAKK